MRYPDITFLQLPRHLTATMLVLLMALSLPVVGWADKPADCVARLLAQASDATTVGELRARCAPQTPDEPAVTNVASHAVVDARLKEDRENVLKPFTLMSHKPNYFLMGAYNSKGYSSELYQDQFANSSIPFDDTEAQFQISIKVPLGVNIFNKFDLYAAYTNRSFWQVYNAEISSPFRETNHEPEAWIQFTPGWEILGFRNSANAFGVVHQSNGRAGVLSRSWNRAFANFVFNRGKLPLHSSPG